MKTATGAAQAILATGQAIRVDLYTITLAGGAGTLRFTTHSVPLVYSSQTYGTQLLIKRGKVTLKAGLEVTALDLELAPQFDHPSGVLAINGVPFLQAVNAGALDGARVLFEKMFLASIADLTPGTIWGFQGRVAAAHAGGMVARVTVHSDLEVLNVAMPRHVYQAGCLHTLYGASCGLTKASFEVSGTVSGTPSVLQFNSGLSQADGYFDLGIVRFTSGPNSGVSRVVRTHLNASGSLRLVAPLPVAPAAGDTFVASPGCDKRQATCSSKFSNLARFRGYPYVPVPETLYDGGAAAGLAPAPGGQGSLIGGSEYTGLIDPLSYVP